MLSQSVQEGRKGGAHERRTIEHRGVPLLLKRKMGLQPHARRILLQQELGEVGQIVRFLDLARIAQEKWTLIHLRPAQHQRGKAFLKSDMMFIPT